jgi:hypothetical protein
MKTKTKKTTKRESKFDFKTIKTYEDACVKLGIDPDNVPDSSNIPDEFRKPIIAHYKLMIIYKAINNGWKPDWSNDNQWKYFPWFKVLSSGFGFSLSLFNYDITSTSVGSRLCTDTSEKARYIGEQFESEYREYLLYSE